MPALSSNELWREVAMGFGIRHSFYSASFMTLDSYSNLHGLQFVQEKNRMGNCEEWRSVEGRVTKKGGRVAGAR